ncbi:hypothetical protein ACN9JG_21080 (plasmid) [Cereibacter azotoformans]|uniref:hypothetical protein n=1 Tax=Cereibacter azotoformans TaxID=43057 RepID=UPI003B21B882
MLKDRELNGFRSGMIGRMGNDWIFILAVDPETSTIYYLKPFFTPLSSNNVKFMGDPDLPPAGDHSASPETLLPGKAFSDSDPEWKQWFKNISYEFEDEGFNGINPGDIAYIAGLIGDAPVLILAFDKKRSQFYYIRDSNTYLYRIGSDHVIPAFESRQRDVARGAAALGLAYCALSGRCSK